MLEINIQYNIYEISSKHIPHLSIPCPEFVMENRNIENKISEKRTMENKKMENRSIEKIMEI